MDPTRAEMLDKIKAQGDVVRKLKEQKAEKAMVRNKNTKSKILLQYYLYYFIQDLSKLANNFNDLNDHLSSRSYIGDEPWPSTLDLKVFDQIAKLKKSNDISSFHHLSRWFHHILSYDKSEQNAFPASQITTKNCSNDINKRVRSELMQ